MEFKYSLTLHTSIPSITSVTTSLPFSRNSIKPLKLAPFSNGGGSGSKGDSFLLLGATMATLLMLSALHVLRMYDDRKFSIERERRTNHARKKLLHSEPPEEQII